MAASLARPPTVLSHSLLVSSPNGSLKHPIRLTCSLSKLHSSQGANFHKNRAMPYVWSKASYRKKSLILENFPREAAGLETGSFGLLLYLRRGRSHDGSRRQLARDDGAHWAENVVERVKHLADEGDARKRGSVEEIEVTAKRADLERIAVELAVRP